MKYPIFETLEMISERIELLKYIIGKRVNDILKIFPNDTIFNNYSNIHNSSLMEVASRGIILILNDNSQIGFSDDESTGSIGAFSVRSPDGDYDKSENYKKLSVISTTDTRYSTEEYSDLTGKKIETISIIQGNYSSDTLNKIGVLLKFEDGRELIIYLGGKLYFKETLPQKARSEIKYIYSI